MKIEVAVRSPLRTSSAFNNPTKTARTFVIVWNMPDHRSDDQ